MGGTQKGRWRNWETVGRKGGQANKQPQRKTWGNPASTPPASRKPDATPSAKQLAEWKARGWQDRSGQSSAKPDSDRPIIPEVEQSPEQLATTKRLWQKHQDAVKLRDMVARSDCTSPEILAMHNRSVELLRQQLDDSKPVEYLYAGQLKKVEQLEGKLQSAKTDSTNQWAAVDEQVEKAKQADAKVKAITLSLQDARDLLPDMAQAAKAQLPKPKMQRAFDDVLQSISAEAQLCTDDQDSATATAYRGMEQLMEAVQAQMAAITAARAADTARKRNPKDSEGDDSMGTHRQPRKEEGTTVPNDGTAAVGVSPPAERSTTDPPPEPDAVHTSQTEQTGTAAEPQQAAPAAVAPQQMDPPVTEDLQRQTALLARARTAATAQQGDSTEVANLRSALRGRMASNGIDYTFLEEGINCVIAATSVVAPDASADDDDKVTTPTAKRRITDNDSGAGNGQPDDDL